MTLTNIQVDPILIKLVIIAIGVSVIGFIFKLIKQPPIIGYIMIGILLGPHVTQLITDDVLVTNLGSFGLVLMLFFVGMEISLPQLITTLKTSLAGTLIQILLSIIGIYIVGYFYQWGWNRIIMLGFVISLSSTAVVIKFLQDQNELSKRSGRNVVGILLIQDILIVPMIIILNYLSGTKPEVIELVKQIIGGVVIIMLINYAIKKQRITFPFESKIKKDHELQVFVAFAVCFSFAFITAFWGLSSALGAFVAGILVSSARSTEWVHHSLHSFKVVFVALFFISIGLLIDLKFFAQNVYLITGFVLFILIGNTLINAGVMKILGEGWRESLYAGAMLAQIGEFSFVLGSTGYFSGIITQYAYQLIISIISITLILSPMWIHLFRTYVLKKTELE